MPELELSVQNFFKLHHDVENMRYKADCSSLDICLNSQRLLIVAQWEQEVTHKPLAKTRASRHKKPKIKHIYYTAAEVAGREGQSGTSTYCLLSNEEEEVDMDCMCEMFRPNELDKEGSYHLVEPRRILQALETVEELVGNIYIWGKKLLVGMADNFYIRFQGSCDYGTVGTINSDPEIICYEENGLVTVEWKVVILCH